MEPSVWGPHGWFFLHSVTMNYPEKPTENDINNYKQFFTSVPIVLPCSKCQKNFKTHAIKYNLDDALKSRESLVKWLFNIHNDANKTLKKKTLTYEEFINYYKRQYFGEKTKPKKEKKQNVEQTIQPLPKYDNYNYIISIILIFIIVYLLKAMLFN